MNTSLPTGSTGRWLALGITVFVLVMVWFAAVDPLLSWYADQAEQLGQRRMLVRRMETVAQSVPDLREQAAGVSAQGPAATSLLEGGTDAIAAASLQQLVQDMAGRTGASLSSTEALPATQAGAYRRIGLHVAVSATWSVLMRLLQAIHQASPQMLVDDLQLHGLPLS